MTVLDKLNLEQQQAVKLFDKPVLVIAGPGTGKTTVLARKIQYILQHTDIKPYMILALTFSESAAINMRKRLATLIGKAAYDVNIFTFHGFANYLIESFPDEFVEYAERDILNDVERITIFKEILLDRNLPLEHFISLTDRLVSLKSVMKLIEALKREGITPKQLKAIIEIEQSVLEQLPRESQRSKDGLTQKYKKQRDIVARLQELLIIFEEYEKRLRQYKKFDFADLINIVNEHFSSNPEFALKVQEMYEYVLVDEYQDTNRAQNTLLFNILSFWESNPNVFVVGDDDQAIYRFQGASVYNLFEFIGRYPDHHQIVLTKNYRSHQVILDAAANVREALSESITTHLEQLQKPINKRLVAANTQMDKNRSKIKFLQFNNETAELLWLVDKIKELYKQGVQYEQIAVLVRRNSQVNQIAEFFLKNKIPYTKSTGTNIFENPYILQLLVLLRFIELPSIQLLNRILHYPFWNIDTGDTIRLLQAVNEYYKDIYKAIRFTKEELYKQGGDIKNLNLGVHYSRQDYTSPSNAASENENRGIEQMQLAGESKAHKIKPDNMDMGKYSTLPLEFDFKVLNSILNSLDVQDDSKYRLSKIFDTLLIWHSESKRLPAIRLVEYILHDAGLLDYIMQQSTKFEDLNAINTLLQNIKALSLDKSEFYLSDFLQIIELIERFDIPIVGQTLVTQGKGVRIMTVHSAKGLEFDYVFIPQFTDSAWSTKLKGDLLTNIDYYDRALDFNSKQVRKVLINQRLDAINHPKIYTERRRKLTKDDERRLFYVALTRARLDLFISFSDHTMNNFGKIKEQAVAEFIYDIPEEFIEILDTSHYSNVLPDQSLKILFKPTDLPLFYISTAKEQDYLKELLKRFKLSPSALITYLKDPMEFYLNYFLKLPSKTNIHLVYGEAFHKTIELALRHYKDTKQILGLAQLKKSFTTILNNYFLTPEEQSDLLKRAERELELYYKYRFVRGVNYPLFLEKVLYANFNGFVLKGKVDKVETLDFEKRYVRIIDIKTARYKSKKELLGVTQNSEKLAGFGSSYLIQLYFYKLLFDKDARIRQGYNWQAVSGAIDFTRPMLRTDRFLPAPVTIEFESNKYEEFKRLVKQVLEEIYSLSFLKKVE